MIGMRGGGPDRGPVPMASSYDGKRSLGPGPEVFVWLAASRVIAAATSDAVVGGNGFLGTSGIISVCVGLPACPGTHCEEAEVPATLCSSLEYDPGSARLADAMLTGLTWWSW